jgi:metal-responsive CopG/Arc/MetJ family transcriptional regulator
MNETTDEAHSVHVATRITETLFAQLEEIATRGKCSKSEIVRDAIKQYVTRCNAS